MPVRQARLNPTIMAEGSFYWLFWRPRKRGMRKLLPPSSSSSSSLGALELARDRLAMRSNSVLPPVATGNATRRSHTHEVSYRLVSYARMP